MVEFSDEEIFILRIRYVPKELKGEEPVWRGTIEHLNSAERKAVKNETEIIAFIMKHLSQRLEELDGSSLTLDDWLKTWRKLRGS